MKTLIGIVIAGLIISGATLAIVTLVPYGIVYATGLLSIVGVVGCII